jgi:hypothetical protein
MIMRAASSECFEFPARGPAAHAENHATLAQYVEHDGFLHHAQWIVPRQDDRARHQFQRLRLRRDIGQDLEIVRARRVVREMVFDRGDVVESHRLGLDGELGFSPEKIGIRHAMQILIPEL